jgi:hypothetical protein
MRLADTALSAMVTVLAGLAAHELHRAVADEPSVEHHRGEQRSRV